MILEELHDLFLEHPKVCTDTRKISENCLFFALKGPNFNGNKFADQALEKGASYAIIDEESFKTSERHIVVENVLETLQKLATFHRNHCNAKVVALTGSNGKTTTKELINQVLSATYETVATQGNLNNHIGVPLTLLSISESTEIAIVEMGANHQGEIAFLAQLAQPDFGYITNFGKAHLQGFGGVEGVIKGKSELYNDLIGRDKSIFLNADDPIQLEKLGGHVKKYGFSQGDPQYYNIKLLSSHPFVAFEFESMQVNTQLVGEYNFPNCCAAVTMGKYFNVEPEIIKTRIENYIPQNNRSQLMEQNGFQIVLDAYNANPTSMEAALKNFSKTDLEHKSCILGDMFELGEDAAKEHQYIADLAQELGFNNVLLVGENFFETDSKFQKFREFRALQEFLRAYPPKKGGLLVKGSRGMALERVLDIL